MVCPPPLAATISQHLWVEKATLLGAPDLGSAEGNHLDLFRFIPISPFSSDLFRFAFLVSRNTPICSDLFRFLPICSDLFSEQIRIYQGTPFCRPLLQIPELLTFATRHYSSKSENSHNVTVIQLNLIRNKEVTLWQYRNISEAYATAPFPPSKY